MALFWLLRCSTAQYLTDALVIIRTSEEVNSRGLLLKVLNGVVLAKTPAGYAVRIAGSDSERVSTIVSKLSSCEHRTALEHNLEASPYNLKDPSIVSVCEAVRGETSCHTTLDSCVGVSRIAAVAALSAERPLEVRAVFSIGIASIAAIGIVVVNLMSFMFGTRGSNN